MEDQVFQPSFPTKTDGIFLWKFLGTEFFKQYVRMNVRPIVPKIKTHLFQADCSSLVIVSGLVPLTPPHVDHLELDTVPLAAVVLDFGEHLQAEHRLFLTHVRVGRRQVDPDARVDAGLQAGERAFEDTVDPRVVHGLKHSEKDVNIFSAI